MWLVGRRSSSCSRKSVTDVDASTGNDSVGGRPRPPKVVMRTFSMMAGCVGDSGSKFLDWGEMTMKASRASTVVKPHAPH